MKSSTYLTEIVDSIPAAVMALDPHGVIVLVNAQAEALFGYAHGDLLGESVDVLMPGQLWSGRPEQRDGSAGNPKRGPVATAGDFRGLRKDGTEFPIEMRSNAVATKDGPIIVSTVVDITDRRQAEAKLRTRKEQLQMFVANAPVAMAMFDREMRYIAASRRWSSNYDLGDRDLRGLSHYDVFPDLPDHWRAVHRRALNGEVIAKTGDRFDRANNTLQWLDWEVQPWYDETSTAGILIFTEDITHRKRAESLFSATIESAPIGMVMSDATGSIVLVNAEAERLFGYPRSELLSQEVDVLVPERFRAHHPEYRKQFGFAPEARVMGAGRNLFGLRKDGSEFPVEIGLSPVETGEGLFILSTVADITHREQLKVDKAKAEELATHDPLTGLPNRVLLLDRVTGAVALARRKRGMVALLCLDVDDFKKVNDTYGHGVGDQLLVKIAARMKKSLRESDTVARLGGDEFLVVAPEIESITQAEGIAGHILESVRDPFRLGGVTLSTTFSLGIALYPRDGATAGALIAASDRGLYVAKGLGKNRLAFADHETT